MPKGDDHYLSKFSQGFQQLGRNPLFTSLLSASRSEAMAKTDVFGGCLWTLEVKLPNSDLEILIKFDYHCPSLVFHSVLGCFFFFFLLFFFFGVCWICYQIKLNVFFCFSPRGFVPLQCLLWSTQIFNFLHPIFKNMFYFL